jgi:hypothetical protein
MASSKIKVKVKVKIKVKKAADKSVRSTGQG